MRQKIKAIVESNIFNNTIIVIIVLNSLALGIETFSLSDDLERALSTFDTVCLTIFIIELIAKIYVYRETFHEDKWNIFDGIIIALSLVPEISFLSSARILRVLRIFKILRVTRLIGHVKHLRTIVQAMFAALPSIGWTFILLMIIYYVYAVIGTNLFGSIAPQFFGDLWQTFYTLFQLTMADDLGNISRPIVEMMPGASVYFGSFIVMTTLLVLNIIVGVVVDSISEIKSDYEKEALEENGTELDREIAKLDEQIAIVKHLLEKEK